MASKPSQGGQQVSRGRTCLLNQPIWSYIWCRVSLCLCDLGQLFATHAAFCMLYQVVQVLVLKHWLWLYSWVETSAACQTISFEKNQHSVFVYIFVCLFVYYLILNNRISSSQLFVYYRLDTSVGLVCVYWCSNTWLDFPDTYFYDVFKSFNV